jgi:hypothetical protein
MERSSVKTTELVVLVSLLWCATGQEVKPRRSEGNGAHMKRNQDFFLKQIFNKYGDHDVITFEVKTLSLTYVLAIHICR